MKTSSDLIRLISGKNVLYIASKNRDYIRVTQEISLLRKYSNSYEVLSYMDFGYIGRLLKIYSRLLFMRMKNYDVIFVGFMPQLVVPLFSWKWHKRIIISDFFVSVYDTLVCDRKKCSPNSVIGKVAKQVDHITVRRSGYLVADTKAHGAYFSEELGADPNRICVLYLEADRSVYHPAQANPKRKWREPYVVLYFGSVLPVQGVDIVLDAVRLLQGDKQIRFVIIGPVEKRYGKVTSENITYIDWLPQKELAQEIAVADLCLAGHFAADNGKALRTIPGKAYIYEAMGKPMILGDSPANHERYTEDKYEFVKMGDAAALADAILRWKEKTSQQGNNL